MKAQTRWLVSLALLLPLLVVATAKGDPAETKYRWDIVSFSSFNPPTFGAGGQAAAIAQDLSTIRFSGSGTIHLEEPEDVTGGGNWQTFDRHGASSGSGTYRVTSLVRFDLAPGTIVGTPIIDNIGDKADAHSGLVVLKVAYSDGSRGILIVSCHLPVGTPDSLFEGVTATKGFASYWINMAPLGGLDGNRTVFHTVR